MDIFLKRLKLPKLTHEETDNLNRTIISEEIEVLERKEKKKYLQSKYVAQITLSLNSI